MEPASEKTPRQNVGSAPMSDPQSPRQMIPPTTRHKIFSTLTEALEDGLFETVLDQMVERYGERTLKMVIREGINYGRGKG